MGSKTISADPVAVLGPGTMFPVVTPGTPNLNGRTTLTDLAAAITGSSPLIVSTVTPSSPISNTAAEVQFSVKPTIAAGQINNPGIMVRIHAEGRYSTTGSPATTMRAYFGATQFHLNQGGAAGGVDVGWVMDLGFMVRTAGAAGILVPCGGGFGSGSNTRWNQLAGAPTAAVDLTLAANIAISWQWDTADPANTVTLQHIAVEVLTPVRTTP